MEQTEVIKLTKLKVKPSVFFGEYLVQQRVLDRFQLFRALQLQDRMPQVRLGTCAVALGYAPRELMEQVYAEYCHDPNPPNLEMMITEAFHREPEIEVLCAEPEPVVSDDTTSSRSGRQT